ncbi:MAG: hypothetical protein M3N33_02030 [Actinomycetota bacterium]|nr:hypothetical protein [Actinomycetota bacterium]
MTDVENGGHRFADPEEIALSFGHVEGRIDDLDTALIVALRGLADAETREERWQAIAHLVKRPDAK